jgi:hypothetical protein
MMMVDIYLSINGVYNGEYGDIMVYLMVILHIYNIYLMVWLYKIII